MAFTQGRFVVSGDGGRTWDERTAPAPMFDLAVDPTDSSRLAATQAGMYDSADEGRDWQSVRDDRAGLLAWPSERSLYLGLGLAVPFGRSLEAAGNGGER